MSARAAAGSGSQMAGGSGGATVSMLLIYGSAIRPANQERSRDVGDVNAYDFLVGCILFGHHSAY